MPEPAPQATETQPTNPNTEQTQAPDPLAPPASRPLRLEDDPNHALAAMIARRGNKKTEDTEKPKEGTTEETAKAETTQEPPKENPKLGELIANALNFRTKKKESTEQKPEETEKAKAETTPKGETTKKEGDESEKTIVKKRGKTPAQPDALEIATRAASAAATAAVKAVNDGARRAEPAKKPEDDLISDEDKHEIEVARFLAQENPKYKGAEKVVLDHIRKAESYASRWEQANPGKVFDPDDEEHTEFYETLQKPWKDHEFRKAEAKMAAKEAAKEEVMGSKSKIDELTEDNARLEMRPIADQTFQAVARELARGVGDGILEKITKEGFDKLAEEDPIVAETLAAELSPLHPMIQTIIEIDDPKGRVRFNEKNKLHMQWLELLTTKEREFAGQRDDNGRMFATRREMLELPPEQRANRWHLTADHLVSELVADSVEVVKGKVQKEKERLKKVALSLGYVPGAPSGGGNKKSDTTKSTTTTTTAGSTTTAKPQSPPDGGAPKIDTGGTGGSGKSEKLIEGFKAVLFPR